ncbi:hypothetical protein SALBM311S_02192 [Streptomyces alboniger]
MSAPRLRATPLPGIGVQYDLVTREQRHLSVVAHRDGARTLSVYRADDPDSCAQSLRMTGAEAGTLIDALKPSHHSPSLLYTTDLGLAAERVEVAAASRWNGRVLGDTRMRTETAPPWWRCCGGPRPSRRRRRTSGPSAVTPSS